MRIRFENHDLETQSCGQFIDLTDDVVGVVERSEVKDGMAVVYSPHTTCAVLINERESGFIASQTIPVIDGKLTLGRWQKIFFCELDRARQRKVFIQVIGEE